MTQLNDQVTSIYAAEQDLIVKTKKLFSDIIDSIGSVNLDGVTNKDIGGIKVATVSFSTIAKHNLNLDPSYYISDNQINAIKKKINNLQTVHQLMKFLDDTLNTGCIVCGSDKIRINPSVKEKLINIRNMF